MIPLEKAEELGYKIYKYCYPHLAYKGSIYLPGNTINCLTELESDLLYECISSRDLIKKALADKRFKGIQKIAFEGLLDGLEQAIKKATE